MASGTNRFKTLYSTDHIEDTLDGIGDINSRAELQAIAEEEGIDINWAKYQELVEQTKEDITKELKTRKHLVYTYDLDGKYLKTYESPAECAKVYGILKEQVNNYMRSEKPYLKKEVIFLSHPLEKSHKTSPKWVYNIKFELVGVYNTTKEAAEQLGLSTDLINQYVRNNKPYYKKGLYFSKEPIK